MPSFPLVSYNILCFQFYSTPSSDPLLSVLQNMLLLERESPVTEAIFSSMVRFLKLALSIKAPNQADRIAQVCLASVGESSMRNTDLQCACVEWFNLFWHIHQVSLEQLRKALEEEDSRKQDPVKGMLSQCIVHTFHIILM